MFLRSKKCNGVCNFYTSAVYALCIPLYMFLMYLFFSYSMVRLFDGINVVIVTCLSDVLFALISGILYYFLYVKRADERNFIKFSGFGRFLICIVFVWLFLFSQLMSFWVSKHFPSEYMRTYSDLAGSDLKMYLFTAVTIAPITEEILFRGFLYRMLRKKYCIFVSVCVSAFLFSLVHGTTEHIPVAVALTLFNCLLIEFTGKLKYAILFHVLYNLFGAAYVMRVPIYGIASVVGYVVLLVLLIIGLYKHDVLSMKLQPGGMRSVESILDEKRKKVFDSVTTKSDD